MGDTDTNDNDALNRSRQQMLTELDEKVEQGGVMSALTAKVGRPPLPPEKRRTESIRLSLNRAERAALEQLVGNEPMAPAIRRLIAERTEKQ